MEKLLIEYRELKMQLLNLGCEESIWEVSHNDSIIEAMDDLIKDIPKDIKRMIKLNLL